jgi:hypothetical protein
LNSVDLPVLGMPTRATFFIRELSGSEGLGRQDVDLGRLGATQDDFGGSRTQVQGTVQARASQHMNFFPDGQAQGAQTCAQVIVRIHALNEHP